jgi:hypothetical protein
VYGRIGTFAANGSVDFGDASTELRITTTSFPPVFAGTRGELEPIYKEPGYYDPVYPPGGVNLHWWYPEWPVPPPPPEIDFNVSEDTYRGHVGEYNGAWADDQWIYVSWNDNRLPAAYSLYARKQSDIRLVRLAWPQ